MKKINIFLSAVIAVISLAGCQTEPIQNENQTSGTTHTVKFISDQLQTKTEMMIDDGISYFFWDDGDEDSFTVFENGVAAVESIGVEADDVMTIASTFNNPTEAPDSYRYDAYLNYGVPARQTCDDVTYDRSADVLVAKPLIVENTDVVTKADDANTNEKELLLQFKRVVAISQMTIKGMTAGEIVESVVLSSDKPITGDFTLDTSNNMAETWSNDGTTLTIIPDELMVDESGEAIVNFITRPVEGAQLTITVTTDENTYSKTFASTITLSSAKVKVFGVTVEEQSSPEPARFEKVTSAPDNGDWSGDYLIVYETESLAFDGSLTTLDATSNTKPVTIENAKIAATSDMMAIQFTVAKKSGSSDKYNLKSASGYYISGTTTSAAASNGLKQATSDSAYEITFGVEDNNVVVYSKSSDQNMILRYNDASNQNRFRFYKSGQKPVQLYKLSGQPAPEKTLSSVVVSGTPTTMEYTEGDTFDPAGLVVTATYDDNTTDEVTESAEWTITPSELAVETTSVSVTAKVGDVTSEAYVINGINVNAIPALTTIDQIFAAATVAGKTATDTRITFNSWVVSGVRSNNSTQNVYVTDGSKGFIIYVSDIEHSFVVGDIISGTADCKVQLYNGAAELTALNSSTEGITVTEGGTITPVQTTIANLSGVNTGAVIDLGQLTYNGTQFTDGENKITPYNTFMSLPTFTSGKKYNVSGIFIIYNTTKEIAPRDANDITEVPAEKYGITINVNNTAYGSVTTNAVDNQAVEGQEVTLTVSPAEGYKLASLTVVDSNDQSVDVSNNKFTMPAKAVRVSATFVEKTYYNITVGAITNGTVTPSKTRAEAGETITVTVEPEEGYKLATLTYNGVDIATDKSFVMPAENVTIAATFEEKTGSEILTTTLTSANIKAGTGGSSYGNCSATDSNGFNYTAYAIKNQHSNATSAYNFWQIKKYASSTAYYVDLPDFPGTIKSIKMTVSSTQKPMTDGGNAATLYFSNSNSTADAGTGVASGTGNSSVTIDAESLDLKSGYITASGAVRIWDIEVEYYSK